MKTTAIEVRELSKRYDSVWALKNVSLTVFEGEVFGLLGPNGAGKTTMGPGCGKGPTWRSG